MIIEFRVRNYRSFKAEQVLNLAASNYDKSLQENVMSPDLPALPELRLVKTVALYGPNAGGKTNFLRALQYLQWLVRIRFGKRHNISQPEHAGRVN